MPDQKTSTLRNGETEMLTEEGQDLLGYRPNWMIRKGNVILLLVLLMLLLLSWFIRYPDVVKTSARLMATNPPKQITAKVSGSLTELLVNNGDQVKKGQYLGYLHSTASYSEIIQLSDWISSAIIRGDTSGVENIVGKQLPIFQNLGELQVAYQEFQNRFEICRQFFSNGYFPQKKQAFEKELQYLNSIRETTRQRQNLESEQREMRNNEFKVYEKLARDKVIAPLELNQYKSRLLGSDQTLSQLNAQITANDISLHNKRSEILDLDKQILDLQQQFRSALLQLKSATEAWINTYTLSAPESGTVLFATTITVNQVFTSGQTVFFLQPDTSAYYIEMMAGQNGFGKLKKGQSVIIKVNGFPSTEYGFLRGEVNFLSDLPSASDSFLVKAALTNGLVTNYDKSIFFKNNLSGEAEIITNNRRLTERFFSVLRGAVRK